MLDLAVQPLELVEPGDSSAHSAFSASRNSSNVAGGLALATRTGPSRATGCPPSVKRRVRPFLTSSRYVPRSVWSSPIPMRRSCSLCLSRP